LAWPYSHAAAVVDAWQAWAPTAPNDLYASLLLTAGGEVERPPAVDMFGSMLGTERDAGGLLDELVARAGADPQKEVRNYMSRQQTMQFWPALDPANRADQDGQQPRPQHEYPMFKSEFFRRALPTEAVLALLTRFAEKRVPGESRELDFPPWGGAYNRMREDATAFVHRRELFSLKHTAVVDAESSGAAKLAARRWLTESWQTVRPWGTGRVFPNFPDPDLEEWKDAYYGTNYRRLTRVKGTYDPDNFFRFHQSVQTNATASKDCKSGEKAE